MLKITINDRQLQAAFTRLRKVVNDQTGAFQDLGSYYLRRIDTQFREQRGPYGTPWAPLKPRTIKRKQKQRQILKPLQATGLFRSSFSYTADKTSVEIGSNRVSPNGVSLGLLHQLGTRHIPARPILPDAQRGLPPVDLREVINIIDDHVSGAW